MPTVLEAQSRDQVKELRSTPPALRTASQFAAALGVSADRLIVNPAPGTATESDCARCERPTELINGTLVEKPVDNFSSVVAAQIIISIGVYLRKQQIGRVSGPDGSFRMSGGNLRLPDVAVTLNERLTGDRTQAVPDWVPDLAIEVLSPGNTPREMELKRAEYFAAGVIEVWELDPLQRTGRVFRDGQCVRVLSAEDSFEGGDVLPGLTISIAEVLDAAGAEETSA